MTAGTASPPGDVHVASRPDGTVWLGQLPPGRLAVEEAYSYTKAGIISGRLPGGELLRELDVAEVLALSRTSVRAAFLLLAGEGLMRLHPKRGALIVPVTPTEVEDVLVARRLVEPWAVATVCAAPQPAREGLARRLQVILERQERAISDVAPGEFHLADCDFHLALVEVSESRLMTRFGQSLRDRRLRMADPHDEGQRDGRRRGLEEHRRLLVAIQHGRAAEARTIIHEHLRAPRRTPTDARPMHAGAGIGG